MLPTTLLFTRENLETDKCIQNISKFLTSAIQSEQLSISGRGITKVYLLMLLYFRSRISIGRELLHKNFSSTQSYADDKNNKYLGNALCFLEIMDFCNLLITYCSNVKSTQLQCCRYEGLSIFLSYCDLTADSFVANTLSSGKGHFCSDDKRGLLQCSSLKSLGIILSQPLFIAEESSLDTEKNGESCCLHPCSEEEFNLFLLKYRDVDYTSKMPKGGTVNDIKEYLPDANEGFYSTDSSLKSGNLLVVTEEEDDLRRNSNIHRTSASTSSSAQYVTIEERTAFRKQRAFALQQLYERGALMLVDTLKKETFSSQKSVYWLQSSSSQRLITCLEALSLALDGYKEEHYQFLLHSGDSSGKGDSKALFFLHHTSIVQSLYTLFTRVLVPSSTPSESTDISSGNRNCSNNNQNSDNIKRPTQTVPSFFPSSTFSASLSTTALEIETQSYLSISTHSLRLMASIAAYNPSKRLPFI
jgi:hypothetical protein